MEAKDKSITLDDLIKHMILLAVFMVPVFILPKSLSNPFEIPKQIIITGLAILLCTALIWFKDQIVWDNTSKMLVLLIALNFFSFLYTRNYYYTKVAVVLNVSCLVIFYFVANYFVLDDIKKLFWVIGGAGIFVSVLVFCHKLNYYPFLRYATNSGNIIATIGNSNYAACYLIFPIFSWLGLLAINKGGMRLVALFGFLVTVFALYITFGRASVLGTMIGVVFFGVFYRKYFKISTDIRALILGVFVAIFVAVLIKPNVIPTWSFDTSSIVARTKYWTVSFKMFTDSPLFGTGLWSFRNQVYDVQSRILEKHPDFFTGYDSKPRRAHNEYLEILNDGGIVAAVALLLFFWRIMKRGFQRMHHSKNKEEMAILLTLISLVMAVMVSAAFFFPFRLNSTLFLFSVIFGCLGGIKNYA